ncbi:MAG: hypothetical protein ACRDQ9_18880, partial [Pseudonocardiaceae bacterium]
RVDVRVRHALGDHSDQPRPDPTPTTVEESPPCPAHPQRKVIGRGTHLVHVRFERDREMIILRPDLVRVIP